MNPKAILTTLAVLGSSTAALADGHAHNVNRPVTSATPTTRREVVSVQRPVAARPGVSRPTYESRRVSGSRPVAQDRDRDRDHDRDRGQWGGNRERGHGPVVRQPVVITPPVYQPSYYQPTYYQPTAYQPIYPQPTYVDDVTPATVNGWTDLTAPLSLASGRTVIELDGRGGPLDNVMLQAAAGATSIDSVQAVFVDGSSQQFAVRTTIDMGNPEVTLDVGHRQVERLIVYGASGYGASYQILGRD